MRYYPSFLKAIPHTTAGYPRVTHPSATAWLSEENHAVRLACVRHAASVCPEPGSNSPSKYFGVRPTIHAITHATLARLTSCSLMYVVCTTQSYDMMLRSHLEASSDSPTDADDSTPTSLCCYFSLFSCQGAWPVTTPRRYSSVHRRASRATPS